MPVSLDEFVKLIKTADPRADTAGLHAEAFRINGVISSESFRGMDIKARQDWLTENLRDKLGIEGLNVGLLFPLVPGEKL